MWVKSFRYLVSAMVIGGATLFLGAQQRSSTRGPSPAVFDPGTSKVNQAEIVKDQQLLESLQHCKLEACKTEAASLRLRLAQLQTVKPHLLRVGGCSGAYYLCNGSPGTYVYASIQDSCATHVTAEACGETCVNASGTTSAYTTYTADAPNQTGTCSFTWTDNTGYHSIEIGQP